MKTSDNIDQLAAALAAVQGKMKPAQMNAVNPFLKNKYADLNSVIDSIKHLLSENGLSYVQMPNTPPIEYGPAIGLTTRLMHSSGQWIEETYTMPMPSEERGKSMMQVAGSAISYARRYALSAMFGIVADEDSDGNGQQDRGRNVSKQAAPPAKPTVSGRPPAPERMDPAEIPMMGRDDHEQHITYASKSELDAALGTKPPVTNGSTIADIRASFDELNAFTLGIVADRAALTGRYDNKHNALAAMKEYQFPAGVEVKFQQKVRKSGALQVFDWLLERKPA